MTHRVRPRHNGIMDSVRWEQLKSILADALRQNSAAARSATIEQSCGHDTDLQHEAASLLAEAEALLVAASDDLEACADKAGAIIPREGISEIGRRAGAYVIISEIGRGGMGAVYLAARADGYFEKQVAIKLLSRGPDIAELARRFRSEREVLARLDHPNIARLLDAGTTDDGVPYIVMEYVDGTPVTHYVEENQLSIAARLELFLKICAAVEVAHRHSIVHRDLKPNNILVSRDGEPKLLDFGIAKLISAGTTPLELTALGHERLTPISASPEQAQGKPVTKSSDIYSLGTLLYEMLTEARPHSFPSRHPSRTEVLNVLCEQEPPLPSSIVPQPRKKRLLRGNLDAILLCALQKDPAKRYASVTGFADDLRRHLAGGTVLARSDHAGPRMPQKRWAQFALIAITIILFSAGMLLFTTFLRQSSRQEAKNVSAASRPDDSAPEKSIAVLPFASFNSARDNDYFLDGVQDNIITDLGRVAELKVTGRSSVAGYRGTSKDVREIARALGVSYVLEGSAQKSGDRIRLNARLIAARTNTQVWAQSYDKKEGDLFLLESELAQEIASQLKAALSPNEKAAIERQPTRDMPAYDLYLRARTAFYQRDFVKAIDLLQNAVNRDQNFALAFCLLAKAHLYEYRYVDAPKAAEHGGKASEHLALGREAAMVALRLAPDLAESHMALAEYYYHGSQDFQLAGRELANISSRRENAEFAEFAALIERRLGDWRGSIRDSETAMVLDPYNAFIYVELLQSYIAVRRFEDAVALADRAIGKLTPNDFIWLYKADSLMGLGRLDEALLVLRSCPIKSNAIIQRLIMYTMFAGAWSEALVLLQSIPLEDRTALPFDGDIASYFGEVEKARTCYQRMYEHYAPMLSQNPNDPLILYQFSVASAGLRHEEEALQGARRVTELVPISRDAMDGPMWAYTAAMINAWLGKGDAAIAQLTKIVDCPNGTNYGQLRFNPIWDDLRSDPRFQEILVKIAQPPVY